MHIIIIIIIVARKIFPTGTDLGQISEVLEEVKDWQTLADKLGIESSNINYITTTCDIATSAPAECQRRMLVRAFCNQQGLVEVENIAENIAKILEVMKKPLLAAKLRRMYPVKSTHQCSDGPGCADLQQQEIVDEIPIINVFIVNAKECKHDRDYLRLVIHIVLFLASYVWFCIQLKKKTYLIVASVTLILALFVPFHLYSLIFYYPLFFFPCYCFLYSIAYMVFMLVLCFVVMYLLFCLCCCIACNDSEKNQEKSDGCVDPFFYSLIVLYMFIYFLFLNEFFC